MTRHYCNEVRTCAHTGETTRCAAPLRLVEGGYHPGDEWRCTVCDLLSVWLVPDTARAVKNNRARTIEEWTGREKEANEWEYRHDDATYAFQDHTDDMRGRLECGARPRATIEDVEPYWQCSIRSVLEEMGIAIDKTLAFNRSVLGIEQLDGRLVDQWHGGMLSRSTNDSLDWNGTITPLLHEEDEWRAAIARLHERSNVWIHFVANLLAVHSKRRLAVVRAPGPRDTWRVVPVEQGWPLGATVLPVSLLATGAMGHLGFAQTSVTLNLGQQATTQPALVLDQQWDDDDDD